MMAISMSLEQEYLISATPVPAKVENGHAQRKNVQQLALFMEVVTTPHLIRKHMHVKDSVAILL